MPSLLHHIRIPSHAPRFPTYALAVEIQSHLQKRLLEYKAAASLSSPSSPRPPAPPPVLVSFTPAPTYTLGRRQSSPLSPAEEERLRAPLRLLYTDPSRPDGESHWRSYGPEVVNAPRGGLATYHGPGQVVFWPVIDLHSPYHRHFTVRDYACLLEKTTIAALARVTGREGGSDGEITGFTTENPGVWVRHSSRGLRSVDSSLTESSAQPYAEERKIAALGVHLRRHVTGLGVAVNVSMPVSGPEETNPWSRITACGLEDKGVTNMVTELFGTRPGEQPGPDAGYQLQDELRKAWADEFEERLGATSEAGEYKDRETEAMILALEEQAKGAGVRCEWNSGHKAVNS